MTPTKPGPAAPDSRMQELAAIARQAMIDRGLLPDFPPAVAAQLRAIGSPQAAPAPGTRDLTGLPWCSIDNDESRDLDQLSVAQPGPGTATRILVAVADVDARVAAGTPIDAHAAANTTTVYTAARIFPMLPEVLSTDLSSLGQDAERPALVIDLAIEADGAVTGVELYRARVLNRAKLAYDAVSAWLDGQGPAPGSVSAVPQMAAQLRLQDRVAQALRRARNARGALELETLAAQPVLHHGVLSDLKPDATNRAKALIQHFMIAANEAVAAFLAARNYPSIRRVLQTPERWDRIVALARGYGDTLPAQPDAAALNAFLTRRRAQDPDRFADLSLAVVKLLGSGEYAFCAAGSCGAGHFGLASDAYTHCTAPNRRFADIVMQRLVKAALAGAAAPYDGAALAGIAAHCTLQEHAAARVERQVRKSAAAALLEDRIGERFDAVVTGASEAGTWVRVSAPLAEGRLVRGERGLDVGDRLRVQLLHTDVQRGFIDFGRID